MLLTVKEVTIKYKVLAKTVYSWFDRKGLPKVKKGREYLIDDADIKQYIFNKPLHNCDYCGKEFSQTRPGHLCCSKKCNEKKWILQNPERDAELKRKSRNKLNPVTCKLCNIKIPDNERECGKCYCNGCYEARLAIRAEKDREISGNIRKKFREYKESIGCSVCGYNKFGGSLDYHHLDSDEKERRIDAKSWYAKNESYTKEIVKCILVCKNCHYEIHNKEKES